MALQDRWSSKTVTVNEQVLMCTISGLLQSHGKKAQIFVQVCLLLVHVTRPKFIVECNILQSDIIFNSSSIYLVASCFCTFKKSKLQQLKEINVFLHVNVIIVSSISISLKYEIENILRIIFEEEFIVLICITSL